LPTEPDVKDRGLSICALPGGPSRATTYSADRRRARGSATELREVGAIATAITATTIHLMTARGAGLARAALPKYGNSSAEKAGAAPGSSGGGGLSHGD
jgi:hypothetical protein